MPSMFFTEEIWKCFVIIQKFFCNNIEHLQEYFKNKVEKYNSFFDDILTNITLILKFDNSIKTKAWELIYSLLDTINPCLLQRNINLDNLSRLHNHSIYINPSIKLVLFEYYLHFYINHSII
jgi:hypothetical protein